jgi:hypothetical protein
MPLGPALCGPLTLWRAAVPHGQGSDAFGWHTSVRARGALHLLRALSTCIPGWCR